MSGYSWKLDPTKERRFVMVYILGGKQGRGRNSVKHETFEKRPLLPNPGVSLKF